MKKLLLLIIFLCPLMVYANSVENYYINATIEINIIAILAQLAFILSIANTISVIIDIINTISIAIDFLFLKNEKTPIPKPTDNLFLVKFISFSMFFTYSFFSFVTSVLFTFINSISNILNISG